MLRQLQWLEYYIRYKFNNCCNSTNAGLLITIARFAMAGRLEHLHPTDCSHGIAPMGNILQYVQQLKIVTILKSLQAFNLFNGDNPAMDIVASLATIAAKATMAGKAATLTFLQWLSFGADYDGYACCIGHSHITATSATLGAGCFGTHL